MNGNGLKAILRTPLLSISRQCLCLRSGSKVQKGLEDFSWSFLNWAGVSVTWSGSGSSLRLAGLWLLLVGIDVAFCYREPGFEPGCCLLRSSQPGANLRQMALASLDEKFWFFSVFIFFILLWTRSWILEPFPIFMLPFSDFKVNTELSLV